MIHIEQIRVQDEVQQLGVHTRTVHKSSLGSNCARHYWETQDMGGRGNSKDEVKILIPPPVLISYIITQVSSVAHPGQSMGSLPKGASITSSPRPVRNLTTPNSRNHEIYLGVALLEYNS